jgi:hypothetical protein
MTSGPRALSVAMCVVLVIALLFVTGMTCGVGILSCLVCFHRYT